MHIAYSLPSLLAQKTVLRILTLGNFDGVHLGHQMILKRTISLAEQFNASAAAITFSNHPATILRQEQPVLALCTLEHKKKLLSEIGLNELFLIPFTQDFSEQSAEQFVKKLQTSVLFSQLVLGSDAVVGKDRKGNKSVLMNLSNSMDFKVVYLSDYLIDEERVSSSRIRQHIQKGELQAAKKCLGRAFSIYSSVQKGAGRGTALGIHTANISVAGLCIPPLGVYAVTLLHQGHSYAAVANLGLAPTFREDHIPILEVHIWEQTVDLRDQYVEVIFHEYLRPEKRFSNVEELKEQIDADIRKAKKLIKI
jgi:riboflavin kinase / FMN adenylyltransferase